MPWYTLKSSIRIQSLVELEHIRSLPPPMGTTPGKTIPVEPSVDSLCIETEDTALYDTVDMEGLKDFVGCSTSLLDSDLDINIMPLIVLPEEVSYSPGPRNKKNNIPLTPKSCSSKASYTTIQKNKVKFLICHKCTCSILCGKAKCLSCKQFFCEDCAGNLFCFICDNCLEVSVEGSHACIT